jgi:hypothetical protein
MGRYDVLLRQDENKEARTRATEPVPAAAPKKGVPPTVSEAPKPTAEHTSVTPLPQTKPSLVQSSRRSFVRRSFDFYEDQVSYLTKASLEERLAGNEGSMNAMVREAVDDFIKKRTSGK